MHRNVSLKIKITFARQALEKLTEIANENFSCSKPAVRELYSRINVIHTQN